MRVRRTEDVDRVVGRISGQFDLAETSVAHLGMDQQVVLVLIGRVDELTIRADKRSGVKTLMPVITPLEVHVAGAGRREALVGEFSFEQYIFADQPTEIAEALPLEPPAEVLEELDEVDLTPPPDVDEYVVGTEPPEEEPEPERLGEEWDRWAPRAASSEARASERPPEGSAPFKPPTRDVEDHVDGPRVVGHILGGRTRTDKVLARFMEAGPQR